MISVSLCMIVKNEEAVLARCLDSLEGLFEEIIIVDTGSTDSTKEIALKYTDKLYDFEWVNDFAIARNFAFSKCSCDYIYSADADEVLDEINRQRFVELKHNLIPEIEIVQMWYLNSVEFATTENYAKELRPKLYKRLRTFTWIDPIHESVNLNPVVFDSDVEINHMPISVHAKRDFAVFKTSIEKGYRLSDKLVKMYARELMIAGEEADFIDAQDFFFMTAFDNSRDDEIRNYCYCVLAKTFRLLKDDAEFFKWALKNICIKPCAEICYETGIYYMDRGDINEAIIWFINASSETEAILNANSSTLDAYSRLAECYEILAENDELMADNYLEEANFYREKAKE